MKIISLEIKNYQPIKNLKIENLGSVVIIAGANGSGKTRLKDAIVQTLQGNPQMFLKLQATREEEKTFFRNEIIEVNQGAANPLLSSYINTRRYGRGNYVGSLVQIDSKRNIETIKYSKVNWLGSDPDDQETSGTYYYSDFANRWQDFMNYIHQKSAIRDKKLAEELKQNPSQGEQIIKDNPNPLDKYKEIFVKLLPGKELQDIKLESPTEFQYKDTTTGNTLPFRSLSSGEQEVVKIIFDVARKDIKHSVIVVDEPELHLHPTLTFKLIETLKTIGNLTNQFIFLTHSADLISTYYSTGDVYFIDAEQTGANQAHKLSELNHSHKELVQLIGENMGLFAVGKKLIFVEGENSSIDRVAYHAIAQKYLPEAKIIPVGSVENLNTLNVLEKQIRNAIFGIDLYMLRDRDGLSIEQIGDIERNGKIKCLKKRHLENYFLDSEILFKVAERLYITTIKQEITQDFIEGKLKEIATDLMKLNLLQNTKEYLGLNHNFNIPTIKSIETKDVASIKQEMIDSVTTALNKLSADLSETRLDQWMSVEQTRLERALSNNSWQDEFQGKEIFSIFCGTIFSEDKLKIRQAYVDIALKEKPSVFDDIKEIFYSFR